MKKLMTIAIVTVVALSSIVVSAGTKLVNFVPAGAEGILSVNVSRVLDLPLLKELRKENQDFQMQWLQFEQGLKNLGLSVKDLPTEAMFFFRADKSMSGAVVRTPLNEKNFVALLNRDKSGKKSYSVETVAGKKVYVLKGKQGNNPAAVDKVAISFLAPDVAVVAEKPQMNVVLSGISKSANKALRSNAAKVNREALAWMVFKQKAQATPVQPGVPNPLSSVDTVGLSLDLTGKNQKDIDLNAEIVCKDANSASMMAMQAQGMLMMLTANAFQKNPALGNEIGKAIKIKPQGKVLSAKVNVPEPLCKKIRKYIEENKKAAPVGRPAAGPACSSGGCRVKSLKK
jgi:predicted transcriptional regulator